MACHNNAATRQPAGFPSDKTAVTLPMMRSRGSLKCALALCAHERLLADITVSARSGRLGDLGTTAVGAETAISRHGSLKRLDWRSTKTSLSLSHQGMDGSCAPVEAAAAVPLRGRPWAALTSRALSRGRSDRPALCGAAHAVSADSGQRLRRHLLRATDGSFARFPVRFRISSCPEGIRVSSASHGWQQRAGGSAPSARGEGQSRRASPAERKFQA